jgi:hypothetical protein
MKTFIYLATIATTFITLFTSQSALAQVIIVPGAPQSPKPIQVTPIPPQIFINPTTQVYPLGIYPYTSDFPGSRYRIYLNSHPIRQPSYNNWQPIDIFKQQNNEPLVIPYTCTTSIEGTLISNPIAPVGGASLTDNRASSGACR